MTPPPDVRAFLETLGLDPALLDRLDLLAREFARTNRDINLVSYSTDGELWWNHLLDSLCVLKDPEARSLASGRAIDVGSGGGFPGVPLALAKPGWSVTLLDSIQKKLRAVEGFLPVLGASVVARLGRAEEIARVPDFREKFDVALCRAVGPLSEVLELTLPFVRPGGFCFLHRGVEARTEAEGVGRALKELGGRLGNLTPYRLPGLDRDRYIVRIHKLSQTSFNYPRRVGIPAKRPL
ncbi:MAG TPA: 16S rRNA (guanine(527)-N(7))-methyltransferase RsmG [Elusimicrobiota bacterium]|nr:16S rRNA (guanine(527)-N(7))-methyltransferase RsmG [Elusimicrobiota bacterium]HMX93826.1 16S rRNA (guanine(527)-N(7))-methyltransferase RsmG [Elusimicrobiota bacterium]HND65056.1 16S rRNA (guanine(527)-N(7))-methyltransferase RsmG [Elusimicrobiota bacterium]